MTQPLVAICVPTYNRAKFLAELLESIDAQNAPEELYEVYVRDNASTDDSESVFRTFAKNRPNWHWKSNEQNKGGLANVRMCTLDATARYIWIVGSDDKLTPDALAVLKDILPKLQECNAAALFLHKRLPPLYAQPKPFNPPFRWLRHVSINVPAFISDVIWEREFWLQFPYEKYPSTLSIPQLDGFVDACIHSTVFGFNRHLVVAGAAENTGSTSFWFYPRHAITDVFEYPLLYKKVLRSPGVDFKSRIYIWLRRASNLRQAYGKLYQMRYHEQYYHTRARDLKDAHGSLLAWPLIYLIAKVILEWPIGARLAERRLKGTPKLPARDRPDPVF